MKPHTRDIRGSLVRLRCGIVLTIPIGAARLEHPFCVEYFHSISMYDDTKLLRKDPYDITKIYSLYESALHLIKLQKATIFEANPTIQRIIYHTEQGGTTVLSIENGKIWEWTDSGRLDTFDTYHSYCEAW